MPPTESQLCPQDKLSSLMTAIGSDEPRAMRALDTLLSAYPRDARLHFLRGSLLAARQDYKAARAAMRHAVDLAPDYAVARFQLGFLLLTSGEPYPAQEAWGPLHALPVDHYLRLFVEGLTRLIRDEFSDTIRLLKEGVERNRENLPMNRDMQLIIDEVRGKMSAQANGEAPVSTVDMLLQQAALKSTKH
jgi:tetratricopeptide (TPR) repeat protein